MERLTELPKWVHGSGFGSGYGNGYGYGYGDGNGYGSGYGFGYGKGSGYGNGYGHGDGSGYGYGYGYGHGYGPGHGYGYSSSNGDGSEADLGSYTDREVTVAMLTKLKACADGVAKFAVYFPDGAVCPRDLELGRVLGLDGEWLSKELER